MQLKTALRSAAVFLVGAVPLMLLFAAHECASTGFFLSRALVCATAENMTPTWARVWLVLFYYVLSRYCILIESPVRLIKVH